MKYPRILAAIRSAKWAVTPPTLQAIADTLGSHMRGSLHAKFSPSAGLIPDSPGPASTQPTEDDDEMPGVAVIQVYGILGKHLSDMETMCGGCDVDAISADMEAALGDSSVQSILFDFDSPGGVVSGIPELAAKIRAADQIKPCYAFTEAQCCSAAYWLASACRAVFCTQSADLGSIGVYVALVDDSEWWAKEGYKLNLIKAGEYKAMGISGQPLSDKERALIQADVDNIYSMFTADVLAGRGVVATETMQGQTFMGVAAVTANLADEMTDGIETLMMELAPKPAQAFP